MERSDPDASNDDVVDPDELPSEAEVDDTLEKMAGPHPHLPVTDEDAPTAE